MGKDYGSKIDLFRILDSKRENFNLKTAKYRKIFEEKIEVINVITPPEIELLIIVSEEKMKILIDQAFLSQVIIVSKN